jgi:hypothetical protein
MATEKTPIVSLDDSIPFYGNEKPIDPIIIKIIKEGDYPSLNNIPDVWDQQFILKVDELLQNIANDQHKARVRKLLEVDNELQPSERLSLLHLFCLFGYEKLSNSEADSIILSQVNNQFTRPTTPGDLLPIHFAPHNDAENFFEKKYIVFDDVGIELENGIELLKRFQNKLSLRFDQDERILLMRKCNILRNNLYFLYPYLEEVGQQDADAARKLTKLIYLSVLQATHPDKSIEDKVKKIVEYHEQAESIVKDLEKKNRCQHIFKVILKSIAVILCGLIGLAIVAAIVAGIIYSAPVIIPTVLGMAGVAGIFAKAGLTIFALTPLGGFGIGIYGGIKRFFGESDLTLFFNQAKRASDAIGKMMSAPEQEPSQMPGVDYGS